MRTFIGIDPGATGGIAAIAEDGSLIAAMPMPTVVFDPNATKTVNMADALAIGTFIKQHKPVVVGIERQNAMRGQGVASTFTLGQQYGTVLAAARMTYSNIQIIQPLMWKRAIFGKDLESNKTQSVERAGAEFPKVIFSLKRGEQSGVSDAIWIAEYLRRTRVGAG